MDPGKRWNLLGGVREASHSFESLRSRCESGINSFEGLSVSDELELALLLLSVPVVAAGAAGSGLVVADAEKGFVNGVAGAAAVDILASLWGCGFAGLRVRGVCSGVCVGL